jgi:hypothetical protein
MSCHKPNCCTHQHHKQWLTLPQRLQVFPSDKCAIAACHTRCHSCRSFNEGCDSLKQNNSHVLGRHAIIHGQCAGHKGARQEWDGLVGREALRLSHEQKTAAGSSNHGGAWAVGCTKPTASLTDRCLCPCYIAYMQPVLHQPMGPPGPCFPHLHHDNPEP